MTTPKYALLSVFDKTGIIELAQQLIKSGYTIVSTGGTAKTLADNKIPVTPIQNITGNPESFDGRMKTISFQVESGILYDRTNPSHIKQAKELQIKPIDIVVCNLYPFEKAIADPQTTLDIAIENIDVGGPTMIRSAAKNFKNVLVIVDPNDYLQIGTLLNKKISNTVRQELAAKAFAHLSFYDSQIARYLSKSSFPIEMTIPGRKLQDLRYGENPHQQGAIYLQPNTNSPFLNLQQRWGRGLSHTNVADINAGLEETRMFKEPAAVVIKHNTPCGIALGKTAKEALTRAIEGDPTSAFGGVIVLNRPMDMAAAKVITSFKDAQKGNIDIVAIPTIDEKTLQYLQKLRKSMGIYTFGPIPKKSNDRYHIKWLDGGFLLQTIDTDIDQSFSQWKVVTKKKPSTNQLTQMQIGWKFISRIRSNAIIVIDKQLPMTRGIGSGQTSRVRSTELALDQASIYAQDAILVSDSFFPFDDSVKLAAKAGISAIVQQGGSINDQASIDAANKTGIAMVFTGRRAFWH